VHTFPRTPNDDEALYGDAGFLLGDFGDDDLFDAPSPRVAEPVEAFDEAA
jgi:hypothetical protein